MIRNTITLSESKAKLELRFTISYLERIDKVYKLILENDIHVSIYLESCCKRQYVET